MSQWHRQGNDRLFFFRAKWIKESYGGLERVESSWGMEKLATAENPPLHHHGRPQGSPHVKLLKQLLGGQVWRCVMLPENPQAWLTMLAAYKCKVHGERRDRRLWVAIVRQTDVCLPQVS